LDDTTALFVKKIDNNSFTLHASKADALSGANKLGYTDTAASASLNGVLPGGNLSDTLYVGNASTNNFTLHSTRAAAEAGTGAIAPSSAATANYRLDTGTTISKTAHGYTTGESVKFNGTAPDGLDTSTVYFVRAVDANNITLHKTPEDATADTNKLSFSNTGSLSLDSGLDLRKAAHGFATGDTVRFNTTAPDGASTTTTYNVRSLSASAFTLHTTAADANNNANIKTFSSGGTFNLDKGSALTKTAHGLTTGEGVNFTSTAPGNTTSKGTYYVNATDANNFTIHSSTADAATATNAIVFNTTGAAYSVDGNVAGDNSYSLAGGASISSYSVGADGKVNMLLTDGTQYVRGQMMLQNFKNPQALMKQGSNLFGNLATAGPIGSVGLSAGATDILKNSKAPGSSGVGRIAAGALELANVDMAREFSNMITTQRAFQANARVVTTSDEILKELMALKR
jgi:flagellar hook protein FlgE